jgi:hypothetical protein
MSAVQDALCVVSLGVQRALHVHRRVLPPYPCLALPHLRWPAFVSCRDRWGPRVRKYT